MSKVTIRLRTLCGAYQDMKFERYQLGHRIVVPLMIRATFHGMWNEFPAHQELCTREFEIVGQVGPDLFEAMEVRKAMPESMKVFVQGFPPLRKTGRQEVARLYWENYDE